jgi:hypothetical protein
VVKECGTLVEVRIFCSKISFEHFKKQTQKEELLFVELLSLKSNAENSQ